MKTCSACKFPKSLDDFSKNSRKTDGKQTYCKECAKGKHTNYYATNRTKIRRQINGRRTEVREENNQKTYDFLTTHPCVDCGEADPVVLEFDHVRGKKVKAIAVLLQDASWARIEEEIAKCEVRCANCHRRRTSTTRGWFKSLQSR